MINVSALSACERSTDGASKLRVSEEVTPCIARRPGASPISVTGFCITKLIFRACLESTPNELSSREPVFRLHGLMSSEQVRPRYFAPASRQHAGQSEQDARAPQILMLA